MDDGIDLFHTRVLKNIPAIIMFRANVPLQIFLKENKPLQKNKCVYVMIHSWKKSCLTKS